MLSSSPSPTEFRDTGAENGSKRDRVRFLPLFSFGFSFGVGKTPFFGIQKSLIFYLCLQN